MYYQKFNIMSYKVRLQCRKGLNYLLLKLLNFSCGSSRVNISVDVGVRIMENTLRGMSAEERNFCNTVVVKADKDTVMLGGRGTRSEMGAGFLEWKI